MTADRLTAVFWIVLGAAIAWGGWSMDRLEVLHINPYTAPGLVPGLLGLGLAFTGVLLFVRRGRAGAEDEPIDWRRLGLAALLCLVYGAGLVGRGLPFWLATFLFVTTFILLFCWLDDGRLRPVLSVLCGAGTAVAVTLVFQELFLVRLP